MAQLSSYEEANGHYRTAMDLKTKGHSDAALTEFRRAAIIDPAFFEAQMEIGLLCREKAKRDPVFLRHTFEAFRKAAQGNLQHEEAHNQYIMAGQKMGMIDVLNQEYGDWVKKYPDNPLLVRCKKNILTLSMAMIPQQVGGGDGHMAASLRKVVLITSLIAIAAGVLFIVTPPFLLKAGKIQKEQVKGLVRVGLLLNLIGISGFVVRSRIN